MMSTGGMRERQSRLIRQPHLALQGLILLVAVPGVTIASMSCTVCRSRDLGRWLVADQLPEGLCWALGILPSTQSWVCPLRPRGCRAAAPCPGAPCPRG